MYLEAVKFGNGPAIEIIDMMSRALVYYQLGVILQPRLQRLPPPPLTANTPAVDLCNFVRDTLGAIFDSAAGQWMFVCSDINPFSGPDTTKFEAKCADVFGEAHPIVAPTTPEASLRAQVSDDGKLRQRCWLLDGNTGRVWCVKYQFASPVYRSTVLQGVVTPAADGVSPQFHVRSVRMWCGAPPESIQFARQQLNLWFCTPATEQCWYRPSNTDIVQFIVDLPELAELPELPDPVTPTGIGAPTPVLGENLSRWLDQHRIAESRVFRLYRTQYPFIYTLMPDDDERVAQIKTELKNSTGSLQPLVITIPTTECELAVREAFTQNPKFSFVRWRCAKYITASGTSDWIPVQRENNITA